MSCVGDGDPAVFSCEIQVTFPTNLQAEQAMKVLRVDKEPSDRVTKTFGMKAEENLSVMVV